MPSSVELYLDLLKKSLLEELYADNELRLIYLRSCITQQKQFDYKVFLDISRRLPDIYEEYVSLRAVGINYGRTLDNLGFQHTMIGRKRLDNIEQCLKSIVADQVPGDLMECGVWRGGAVIFMRGFLAAYEIENRLVWAADSFAGLPAPTFKEDEGLDLSGDRYPMLAIDLDTVKDLFARYSLLDGRVRFLKGWFKDTLPSAPIGELALLRIDGDLYESTVDCLRHLYGRVAKGGYVIIDDYGALPQCRLAVTDFRDQQRITTPLQTVDWTAVYWRKEE
jgi:O-methyltransferase